MNVLPQGFLKTYIDLSNSPTINTESKKYQYWPAETNETCFGSSDISPRA